MELHLAVGCRWISNAGDIGESKVFKQMLGDGKAFNELGNFPLFRLVVKRNQLHLLKHLAAIEGNVLALLVVGLEDVEEGLEDDGFDVVLGESGVVAVQQFVELGVLVLLEDALLLYLLGGDSVVLLLVVPAGHHPELGDFLDADFEVAQDHAHAVLLNADVDLREFPEVLVVEVAQLDPLVYQLPARPLVVFLVLLYLGVVVLFASLVHFGSRADSQPPDKVMHADRHMRNVEVEDKQEACPAEAVEEGDSGPHIIDVARLDLVQQADLYEVGEKEQPEGNLERQAQVVALVGDEGPDHADASQLQDLEREQDAHLGVLRGVEERQSDHHEELLIVGEEVEVVGTEPVLGRPVLVDLH